MKGSLATSGLLHALVLTWAMVSLGSPAEFQVADVEALPVDIVPYSEMTQVQQGDKKAPKKETSSPVPTKRPETNQPAENIGDNDTDLKTAPTPNVKPSKSEATASPEKNDKPEPAPDPVEQEIKKVEDTKPASEPATEVAALPEAKQEVKPETKPEPTPAEEKPAENPEAEALPEKVPTPAVKPKVEKPATSAKTPERKNEQTPKEQKKKTSTEESKFNADEIAALLNRQEPSAGGTKRSTQEAALGGKKTIGVGLSANEIDGVKGQIQGNWSLIAGLTGVEEVRVTVRVQLDPSGNIVGTPEVTATGGPEGTRRAVESSTLRAIRRSAPLQNLPPEKYDGEKGWNTLVLNFDPSEFAL